MLQHRVTTQQQSRRQEEDAIAAVTDHAAAGVAGVLQVTVEQFCGSVLEGFGQSSQQHGEFRSVELKQRNEHHLSRLQVQKFSLEGERLKKNTGF